MFFDFFWISEVWITDIPDPLYLDSNVTRNIHAVHIIYVM